MMTNKLGENNKRIEILKHEYGNINKYDKSNPYWNHSTKLSEWVVYYGGWNRIKNIELIYCIV